MDLLPKFIVENDYMILSNVQYHKELAIDKENSKGGGLFKFDQEKNSFTLFGKSRSYGQAKVEDIIVCIKADKVFTNKSMTHSIATKHTFYYDTGSEIIKLNNNG